MANELTNTIMEERLQIGIEMAKKLLARNGLKITDAEILDAGLRIGQSLFIEKNKSFRASQIPR